VRREREEKRNEQTQRHELRMSFGRASFKCDMSCLLSAVVTRAWLNVAGGQSSLLKTILSAIT
jgi:hypothetical protein